jgi:glyoxylase-like metal-dependent hydrolase (beta-lactamase superfamily II)
MKVTDEVYAMDSTKGNYAYLIQGEETILIDTGRPGQGKGILNDLKTLGIKPDSIKHILLTHHDVDHVGGLAFLQKITGAEVHASLEDIPYIYGEKKRPGIKRLASIIMRAGKPENIIPFSPEETIWGLKVIPTPGHTPGHVCFLYADVLFAGDLIRTSHSTVSPMNSMMVWNEELSMKSIDKINHYPFKWICPAHGQPIKVNGKIEL